MSVTLGTPFTFGGAGFPAETDAAAAVTNFAFDLQANTMTVTLMLGTATQSAGKTTGFTPGARGPFINVVYDLVAQTWRVVPGGASGGLTTGELNTLQAVLTYLSTTARNALETFAVNHNLFGAGATTVPW